MHERSLGLAAVMLSLFVLWLVAGCGSSSPSGGTSNGNSGDSSANAGMMGGPGSTDTGSGMMGGNGSGSTSYSSVGQRIWLTGIGGDGRAVRHSAPTTSQGALMMGGGGCASCHGADGKGGTIQAMMGTVIRAPDVTYSELVSEGYTDSTIGRAIVDGLDEQGKALDQAMPRWQMDSADVAAVVDYLKQLSSQ